MKKSDFALNVNPYLWEIGYFRYKRIFGARPIKPHFEPILYFKKLPLTRNLAKSKPAQKNRFRTGPKSEEVGGNGSIFMCSYRVRDPAGSQIVDFG